MRRESFSLAAVVNLQQFAEFIPAMNARELAALLEGRLTIDASMVAVWTERMRAIRSSSPVGAVEEAMSRQWR